MISRHEDGVSSFLAREGSVPAGMTSTTSCRSRKGSGKSRDTSQKSLGEPSGEKVTVREAYGKFDSGGVFWVCTIRRQVFALVVAQCVLAGVTAVNGVMVGVILLVALAIATWQRAQALDRHYSRQIRALPLEQIQAPPRLRHPGSVLAVACLHVPMIACIMLLA